MTEMTMIEAPNRVNGRPIKFTPEKIEQIKNLVERGMPREEIAETLGLTLGSLQVTCSRLGISLRRPRPSIAPLRKPNVPRVGNIVDDAPKLVQPKPAQVTPLGFDLVLVYGRRQKPIELPASVINYLLVEAAFNERSIGSVIVDMLEKALQR